mgnify:CR=1 FL=1
MDFPNYMVLNPIHIENHYIPKKNKVLEDSKTKAKTIAHIACPKCVYLGLVHNSKTNSMPNWFKAILPDMNNTKLNIK